MAEQQDCNGHQAFAYRQVAVYERLEQEPRHRFERCCDLRLSDMTKHTWVKAKDFRKEILGWFNELIG
jgi:hypothetical protein